ncbi:hypothetical protein ACAG26_15175 [Mycobacterium sp. pUA109]|uniref:hypothetical protein n=1 Tax=Mycobacterium sp. pUA109 TaxID=3238982 RepID=UPI00351B60C4
MTLAVVATATSPAARAADAVRYEITSQRVSMLNNIEYMDAGGRRLIENVALPWRLDVALDDADGATGQAAQLRADWRPTAGPAQWVVVAIYNNGTLVCRSILDVGNATCYGNTPHVAD